MNNRAISPVEYTFGSLETCDMTCGVGDVEGFTLLEFESRTAL